MLMDLKAYLMGRGCASLSEIARRVAAEPDAVRPMLEQWIRKRRVRRVGTGSTCRGCATCAPADVEFYEWIDDDPPAVMETPVSQDSSGQGRPDR